MNASKYPWTFGSSTSVFMSVVRSSISIVPLSSGSYSYTMRFESLGVISWFIRVRMSSDCSKSLDSSMLPYS